MVSLGTGKSLPSDRMDILYGEEEQRYFEGRVSKTWRLILHKEQRQEMNPNDFKVRNLTA